MSARHYCQTWISYKTQWEILAIFVSLQNPDMVPAKKVDFLKFGAAIFGEFSNFGAKFFTHFLNFQAQNFLRFKTREKIMSQKVSILPTVLCKDVSR